MVCQIPEYERAVVFGSTLDMAFVRGPGLIFVLPFLEKVIVIIIIIITILLLTADPKDRHAYELLRDPTTANPVN